MEAIELISTNPGSGSSVRSVTYNPSLAILVRKSVVVVDGVERLAEVVGDRVGGGDGLPSGLDLNGAVAAGGLDEFPD